MCSKQVISCQLLFLLAIILSSVATLAQISIDDVHVTPHQSSITLANAAYSQGAFAGGGLLHTRTDLVLVPVTITDNLNRPVVGLDQDNFRLFENKKAQEIKDFSSQDVPVSVGFIVDTSGSMGYKLERVRDAVIQFCETANPQDEFFMITFNDSPRLVSAFTTRTQEIENDLLTVRSHGRTSLLDAIYMGLHEMRSAHYSRRALMILSDGGDNHSRYTEHDVKAAAREADVLIYAVGTYDQFVNTEEEMLGPDLLRSIAEVTGGRAFTLSNVNEMASVTRAIGLQLRHQYVLGYEPQSKPHDGKWHKISVKLRLPRELHNLFLRVDARTGYYATESR
jgi:Ca-activated chloride channel homolog